MKPPISIHFEYPMNYNHCVSADIEPPYSNFLAGSIWGIIALARWASKI
jgi:hypothetical protein